MREFATKRIFEPELTRIPSPFHSDSGMALQSNSNYVNNNIVDNEGRGEHGFCCGDRWMFVGDVLLQIMVAGTGSCTIQGTEDEEGKKNLLVRYNSFLSILRTFS